MKKILSLLLAIIGVNVASAQVTATCNGKEVQDGDEIVYYAHVGENGVIECGPKNVATGDVLFKSLDPNKKASITLHAQFPVESAEDIKNGLFSWCAGGSCADPKTTNESRDIKDIDSKGKCGPDNMSAMLKPNATVSLHTHPITTGKYFDYPVQFTVRSGMTSIMTFTLRFVYSEETLNKEMSHITTGIGSTTVQAQSVKFNGQALAYHFNGQAVRQLNVYGTDGKLVKTAALTATDGQLSLAGLPKGVYVFHLTEGNATLQSGKVVLK